MGNSLGGKRTAKVMKISGETIKLKTPIKAKEIVKDYPGHVLLESEAVKHYGTKAKPLEADQDLDPKRLYFLVELPKPPTERNPRRVRSGINLTAKDRLENLMLARRSVSDLSIIKSASGVDGSGNNNTMRVKMRLPKAEVERLVRESRDRDEAAAKIVDLCMGSNGSGTFSGELGNSSNNIVGGEGDLETILEKQVHWKSGHRGGRKGSEKRVSFQPDTEADTHTALAS